MGGALSKKIQTEDLICVSATPQSLQDQNCLSLFYKEFSDTKKTKFKIAELKLACTRSISKLVMIEKLRLNVKNKFTFDHLKLEGEIPAEEYLKGLINKPRQVYQGIKILYFVYLYKNAMHFFSIFKRKFGREKKVIISTEFDKLDNKQYPDVEYNFISKTNNNNNNKNQSNGNGNNLIKLSSNGENLDEFIKQKSLKNLENEIEKNNNNIFSGGNKGINDSLLFNYNDIDNIHSNEKNPVQYQSSNLRLEVSEKNEYKQEGIADVIIHHQDINLHLDDEHLKDSASDLKKIIMQNQKEKSNDLKQTEAFKSSAGYPNIINNNKNLEIKRDNNNVPNSLGNLKDPISFVKLKF